MGGTSKNAAIHPRRARDWLSKLRQEIARQPDEGHKSHGLRCVLTLESRIRHWDSNKGDMAHTLAILAVEEDVIFIPGNGIEPVLVRLAVPTLSKQTTSAWAKVLRAIANHQLERDELMSVGIYAAAESIGKPPLRRPLFKGAKQLTPSLRKELASPPRPPKKAAASPARLGGKHSKT